MHSRHCNDDSEFDMRKSNLEKGRAGVALLDRSDSIYLPVICLKYHPSSIGDPIIELNQSQRSFISFLWSFFTSSMYRAFSIAIHFSVAEVPWFGIIKAEDTNNFILKNNWNGQD